MRCHSIPDLLRRAASLACAGALLFALEAPAAGAERRALRDGAESGGAQNAPIVALVDAQGRTVFINASDPSLKASAQPTARRFSARAPAAPINHLVEQTASRHQVDPQLVDAIIQVESDYNSKAVSRRGAMGLMQLIPATASRFGVRQPFDAEQNLEGGVSYLRYLLDLFGGDLTLAVAAYNAGENSVLRRGGVPAYPETLDYVKKVTSLYKPARENGTASGPAPIYRYVDARGVVHFTNGDGL